MHRRTTPAGPRLEALMDERDHLLIQISMEGDNPSRSIDRIEALRKKLIQLEDQIKRDWGDFHA